MAGLVPAIHVLLIQSLVKIILIRVHGDEQAGEPSGNCSDHECDDESCQLGFPPEHPIKL